ncbi:MAG: hypothetical protein HFJ58_03495 [Clostridia bacterium]|nr:hypothetical protein [Clostridia bacterium]
MRDIPDFLIEMLNKQYDENTVNKIIQGYNIKRKVTLRVNNLKTDLNTIKNELDKLGIKYETVKFYENALIIDNAGEKDLQTLKMYEKGEIYLQSLSSMLPPIVLNPQPNMDILDMCAAPRRKNYRISCYFKQ